MSYKAGEIFDKARFFLNDTAGAVFTDEVLLPALQIAIKDLELECEDSNIPFTNVSSAVITVPQGSTNIGGSNGPALPDDLVEIVALYERTSGTNNSFLQMRRSIFPLPNDVVTSYLGSWSWINQSVQFIGANGPIEIRIDYIGSNLRIIDKNSQILVFNSISFLWFRTAALAANYVGENKTRSDELNVEALRCIETMENIGIKNQQSMPVRRRPFMSGYRNSMRGNWW